MSSERTVAFLYLACGEMVAMLRFCIVCMSFMYMWNKTEPQQSLGRIKHTDVEKTFINNAVLFPLCSGLDLCWDVPKKGRGIQVFESQNANGHTNIDFRWKERRSFKFTNNVLLQFEPGLVRLISVHRNKCT
jgi:hypothetical protein